MSIKDYFRERLFGHSCDDPGVPQEVRDASHKLANQSQAVTGSVRRIVREADAIACLAKVLRGDPPFTEEPPWKP